jgi:hypothetical protein
MVKQNVIDRLVKLPDHVQRETMDYIDFLLNKYVKTGKSAGFRFDWEGGLSELKDTVTAVQLQHKASGKQIVS